MLAHVYSQYVKHVVQYVLEAFDFVVNLPHIELFDFLDILAMEHFVDHLGCRLDVFGFDVGFKVYCLVRNHSVVSYDKHHRFALFERHELNFFNLDVIHVLFDYERRIVGDVADDFCRLHGHVLNLTEFVHKLLSDESRFRIGEHI